MIVLRTLAIVAGIGILAAVAHVTITATGGYGWNTNARRSRSPRALRSVRLS